MTINIGANFLFWLSSHAMIHLKDQVSPEANFHFRNPRLFLMGVLLEGLRRLMSYKLPLHAFVVPSQKILGYLILDSLDIRNKTVTMKLTKKAAVKLSDHTPIIYLLSTWLASCNLKNGLKRFIPQIIRNNDQFSAPWKENAQKWWKLFLFPKFGDPRNRGP